ncbi:MULTISPECIES: hypothetical protein [Lysinibacillus]|uniref:hypothetical protein n=1 Tax=Lysinibacillus TaxID=400634 RepID=UPI0004D62A68|nr:MULTISPECIES: hypothetical protein [Lysinibacillus]AJK88521.1 hypothetical protein HR49_15970 [Lysinibacillus fusiformis]KHK53964.1 hypothetical protein PI85_07025 [Lysinibacillus sp. A1]MEE3809074.1 hypothetical protein [Lysinibacillus fusiformis]
MTHFEAMEALGQVTIYDVLEKDEKDQPTFIVGDKVHVAITPESDYEAYTYLEAYFPIVLKKPGEIEEILPKNQYRVNFAGQVQIMRAHELTF